MSEPALVSAEGLHTYYGPSHVLHGVDFEVRRGETVALMGRNGMGKTTLLRSLMGLTPPKRGRIMIDGQDSNLALFTGQAQTINNPDIVAEFRLLTNQFAPEYGRASGSVVDTCV